MALQKLLKDKTVIIIVHKLAIIQNANQIIVLENGAIQQRARTNSCLHKTGCIKDRVTCSTKQVYGIFNN
ncbi:MAG: hypothetical protein J6I73_01475 [Treponema sp.]|nr:hypothetical protein [Treponema sp.]